MLYLGAQMESGRVLGHKSYWNEPSESIGCDPGARGSFWRTLDEKVRPGALLEGPRTEKCYMVAENRELFLGASSSLLAIIIAG